MQFIFHTINLTLHPLTVYLPSFPHYMHLIVKLPSLSHCIHSLSIYHHFHTLSTHYFPPTHTAYIYCQLTPLLHCMHAVTVYLPPLPHFMHSLFPTEPHCIHLLSTYPLLHCMHAVTVYLPLYPHYMHSLSIYHNFHMTLNIINNEVVFGSDRHIWYFYPDSKYV